MSKKVISVQNLVKGFRVYQKDADRFFETLNVFGKKYHTVYTALDDISFDVYEGEAIGILGRNGAGKSTLLKILTGVLTPSSGKAEVSGSLYSLLELGAGFNPDYTGIENIYLQGSLFGLSEVQTENRIAEILEFADIGDFVYQPVRTYSSGMFARLAFSIAISFKPSILIVDEVLSVGDVFFQQKCLKYMRSLLGKTTILYVSHDLHTVSALANRVLLIEKGKVHSYENVDEGISDYTKALHSEPSEGEERPSFLGIHATEKEILKNDIHYRKVEKSELGGVLDIKFSKVAITDQFNKSLSLVSPRDVVRLHFVLQSEKELDDIFFGYIVEDRVANKIAGETTIEKNQFFKCSEGIYSGFYEITWPRLNSGDYTITLGIGQGIDVNLQKIQCWAHNAIKISSVNQETVHCIFNHSIDSFELSKVNNDK